jgi:hypothetical protein
MLRLLMMALVMASAAPAFAETAAEAGARIARERGMKGETARCFAAVFAEFSQVGPDGQWKPLINPRRGTNTTRDEFQKRCRNRS